VPHGFSQRQKDSRTAALRAAELTKRRHAADAAMTQGLWPARASSLAGARPRLQITLRVHLGNFCRPSASGRGVHNGVLRKCFALKATALLVGLFALALSGCVASAAGPQTGTVTGHVFVRACGGPAPPLDQKEEGCKAQPATGVSVVLEPQRGGQALTATTGSGGTYSITVPAGTYVVHLGSRQPTPSSQVLVDRAMATSALGPQAVTVGAGQEVTADFTIAFNLM
jgi:hypothetical protein